MLDVKVFFDIAKFTIEKEELELNWLLKDYNDQHQGVAILFETTYVYLIYKELLRQSKMFFNDILIKWEYGYKTENNQLKFADLAIFDKKDQQKLLSVIEFKIWFEENDKKIKNDIQKMINLPYKDIDKYLFLIVYGGTLKDNEDYLLKNNNQIQIIHKCELKTKYFKPEKRIVEDNFLGLFVLKIM